MKSFAAVQVTSDECSGSFDRMLRRFIRRVRDEGVLKDHRASLYADKPSAQRRRKKLQALRREKSSRGGKNRGGLS